MEPLLKITRIPMEYELSVQHARLERGRSSPPVVEISRQRGGFTMRSRPAKLQLDSFEARNTLSPSTRTAISQNAQKGIQAASEAAESYSSEAAQMRWSRPGEGGEMLSQIFAQRMQMPTGQFQLSFLPAAGIDITYQAGDLTTTYQMDRMAFNLKLNNSEVEYIPGSVDISITQYPDVLIEYMGSPLYVPPSAESFFIGGTVDIVA